MRILNEQKKQLADILRAKGLNILDFYSEGSYEEFKIKFKFEYFSFAVKKTSVSEQYYLTVYPVSNRQGYSVGGKWEDVLRYYKDWINGVYGELNTPTGWETFESENYLNADYAELNQPFTEAEKLQAQRNIQELKARIKLIGLNENALDAINSKLDELSAKVDELNKFDWKSLLIGTLVSIIMGFTIPPECSGMIWEYLKSSFNNLRLKS